jgi:geranylgeranyl pyrophosphate synthase
MAGGQMIDMLAEGRTLGGPAVTRLQALKTGRLIQFSAEAGAMLGRAPQPQRRGPRLAFRWSFRSSAAAKVHLREQ